MKTYKLTSIIWREEEGYVSIGLYLENAKRLRILGEIADEVIDLRIG